MFVSLKTLLIILLAFGMLFPKTVDHKQALEMAQSFLQEESALSESGSMQILKIRKIGWAQASDSLYLVVLQPKGFILLNTDDRYPPVIAFSGENDFVGLEPTCLLLQKRLNVQQQIAELDRKWVKTNQIAWQTNVQNAAHTLRKTSGDSIYYFPTPVWGQGNVNGVHVFNIYTPNHWSAGCVATAMAEVLAYYHWPLVGTGSHCYTENDVGQLCADFKNTTYDWSNILPKYINQHTTTAQRQAAGLLTFHAAVSVNMDFSANGSTANVSNAPYALHHYFRHSGHYKVASATNFWPELINNMKDARPAVLAISRSSDGFGHAIVADGYSERNGLFHLNMGWNGSDNGWYDIQGNWNVSGYDIVDGAAKGIVPSPMIRSEVQFLSPTDFILSWAISDRQKAQYFEVQQATSSNGPWTTLSDAVADTFLHISVPQISRYYYRVRTRRDDIWWDWSAVQVVSLGGPRYLTFNVNMRFQNLGQQDSVVLRGNILPLKGSENSPALKDEDGDSVYSITLPFDVGTVGQELLYRFAIAGPGGTRMESFNRSYVIGAQEYQNLDTVYFDNYTALAKTDRYPRTTRLIGNYPNPFNPTTTIRYYIGGQRAALTPVRLLIFNVLGQKVAQLVSANQKPGEYRVTFNAGHLPSGLYFCRFEAGGQTQIKKMILTK